MPLAFLFLPSSLLLPLEAAGVLLMALGTLLSGWCLWHALLRQRLTRQSGANGVLRVLSQRDVRSEVLTLLCQLALLCVSCIGTAFAPTDEGMVFHGIAGTVRACVSVLMAFGSWRELVDRRKVMRMLGEPPVSKSDKS